MNHKGTVRIGGKSYPVEVVNGERFIDGKTVDEFMKSLSVDEVMDMAQIGHAALKDEKAGTVGEQPRKYQSMSDALHGSRVN